jgi:L-ascorbate metabolism protein UlaG (beta-lactamase superfamily)
MEKMPSDHFDGKRFFTPGAPPVKGFREVLRWMLARHPEPWQLQPAERFELPPVSVTGGRILTTFINHSTVLIQVNGVNILTDPIWSERASPIRFAGPKRFSRPGVPLDNLPPIHAVLLSHNHYDHMDIATLRRIQRAHAPQFLVPLANGKYLQSIGTRNIIELDWWGSHRVSDKFTIHLTPAQHFSGRGLFDRNRALWASYVLETEAGNIFFGADTGFGPHFAVIKSRFQHFRVALLPIGAYEPRWFMSPVHMSPEEAVRAHEILNPETSVGIHFGTFPLADDSQFAARNRILEMAEAKGLAFRVLRNGEAFAMQAKEHSLERFG